MPGVRYSPKLSCSVLELLSPLFEYIIAIEGNIIAIAGNIIAIAGNIIAIAGNIIAIIIWNSSPLEQVLNKYICMSSK